MTEPASAPPDKKAEPPPLVLAYDHHTALKDPRARWVLPAFCLGMLAAGVIQGLVMGGIKRYAARPGDDLAGMDGLLVPIGFSMFCWLFAALSLGPCLILRRKIIKEVRYARFPTALIWGFFVGAPPWAAVTLFDEPGRSMLWFFAMVGWNFIMPAVAGFFLCYRSALRD